MEVRANVGHVIMELEVMIDDGMIGMVELQQMLQSPCSLIGVGLYIVCSDGRESDSALARAEYPRDKKWVRDGRQ